MTAAGAGMCKGTNLLHMQSFTNANYGHDEWLRVLQSMPPEDREALQSLVAVGWYDVRLQVRLLRTIDTVLGRGDLALVPHIGQYEAEQDLTGVHRMFLKLVTPETILRKAGQYWQRFYDTGRWEVVRHAAKSASATLSEFNVADKAFCMYLTAYIFRMFMMSGARHGALQHTHCRAHADVTCRFEGHWL